MSCGQSWESLIQILVENASAGAEEMAFPEGQTYPHSGTQTDCNSISRKPDCLLASMDIKHAHDAYIYTNGRKQCKHLK